ncbi:MAG: hypothetical protein M3Z03_02845, partial [Actinomycetota bacterium]|nr:hypothetical protein [Actinomycetota bacterium]
MRPRRRLVAGLALLLAGAGLGLAPTSRAQDEGSVQAFALTSRAHAIRVLFDTPGSLPIGPLVELTAPESRVNLATGDQGTAFSAIGYPGPVLAGLPQIAATAGADLSFLPPYPLAITATSSGPTEVRDTTAVPGSSMTAVVDGGHVVADTRTPALGLPGVIELGTLRSSATADHEDGGVRATATTEAGGVSLLGGLITIGAVRSTAEASSVGGEPERSASTKVLEASLLGAPITIGVDGIELVPGSSLLQGVVASVLEPLGGPNGLLAATGLRIRAGTTVESLASDRVRVGAEGLTIEVNSQLDIEVLDLVLNALPPIPAIPGVPVGPTDAIGLLQANQVRSVSIGQAVVDLTARPEEPAVAPPSAPPAPGDTGVTPSFDLPSAPVSPLPLDPGRPASPASGGSSPLLPP